MLLYQIDAGCLTVHDGALPDFVAYGYSGLEECKNRSSKAAIRGRGPIPPGTYKISPPRTSKQSGPITLDLTPMPGTNTFGRSAFEAHGDSLEHPGAASHGCIVLPKYARLKMVACQAAGDDLLTVVP